MAGLLEEMARGMSSRPARPAPPARRSAARSRHGSPRWPAARVLRRRAAPTAARRNGGRTRSIRQVPSVRTSRRGPPPLSIPPTCRGPVTLEIAAYGKTYAFPMASERARDVLTAWEAGGAVPESRLHESGITTARLQPLLERFVLRPPSGRPFWSPVLSIFLDTAGVRRANAAVNGGLSFLPLPADNRVQAGGWDLLRRRSPFSMARLNQQPEVRSLPTRPPERDVRGAIF